jgi:hypothetical protein
MRVVIRDNYYMVHAQVVWYMTSHFDGNVPKVYLVFDENPNSIGQHGILTDQKMPRMWRAMVRESLMASVRGCPWAGWRWGTRRHRQRSTSSHTAASCLCSLHSVLEQVHGPQSQGFGSEGVFALYTTPMELQHSLLQQCLKQRYENKDSRTRHYSKMVILLPDRFKEGLHVLIRDVILA